MADDKELQVKITSDTSGLKAGTQEAAAAFSGATNQIKSSINSLNTNISTQMKAASDSFTTSLKSMISFGAMFGGMIASVLSVGALKGAIDAALRYRESVEGLSRAMGIASEEASVLNVALRIIGVSTETYISSNMKLAMHVRTSEEELIKLGVVTRNTNGIFLTQSEIFQNAIKTMGDYKSGTDRNQFALYAFGRGAQEVYELMRLNSRVMEEARIVAERYGLVISDQASNQLERYEEKLNIMKLLFDAIKIKVGMELIPELTKMSGWFSDVGPGAINVFVTIARSLLAVVDAIGTGFKQMAVLINGAIYTIVTACIALFEASGKIMSLDFSGAWDTLKQGGKDIAGGWQVTFNDMYYSGKDFVDRMSDLFSGMAAPPFAPTEGIPTGTKTFEDPKMKKEESRISTWQEELERKKVSEQAWFGWSLEKEKSYWEEKLSLTKRRTKEWYDVRKMIFDLDKKSAVDAVSAEVDAYKFEQASAKAMLAERIAIQDQIISQIKATYGEESKEYRRAVEEKGTLLRQFEEEEIRVRQTKLEDEIRVSDGMIEAKLREVETRYQLGVISGEQEAKITLDLLNQKYAFELDHLTKIKELWAEYPKEWQNIEEKIKALKQKSNSDIGKADQKLLIETKKTWDKFLDPIQSAISGSIQGMIQGTLTLKAALDNLFQSILASFVDMVVKMLMQWISSEIGKIVISKATAAASGLGIITGHAAEAAAGAYAATAAIPYVGPILAPAAAATAFGGAMAWATLLPAAKGGWDVDRDSLAMLHKSEMVLPSGIAEGLRGMISSGRDSGGKTNVNVKVSAMDGTDALRVFDRHARKIAKSLEGYSRNRFGVRR